MAGTISGVQVKCQHGLGWESRTPPSSTLFQLLGNTSSHANPKMASSKKATPEDTIAAEVKDLSKEPVFIEVETPSEEPEQVSATIDKAEIETDVRTRLTKRPVEENPFVPSSPAVLEAAAKQIAEQEGFDFTRGTSIGARLIARSRKLG